MRRMRCQRGGIGEQRRGRVELGKRQSRALLRDASAPIGGGERGASTLLLERHRNLSVGVGDTLFAYVLPQPG